MEGGKKGGKKGGREGRKGEHGICGECGGEGRQGIGRDGEFQHHGYTCSEAERVPWRTMAGRTLRFMKLCGRHQGTGRSPRS